MPDFASNQTAPQNFISTKLSLRINQAYKMDRKGNEDNIEISINHFRLLLASSLGNLVIIQIIRVIAVFPRRVPCSFLAFLLLLHSRLVKPYWKRCVRSALYHHQNVVQGNVYRLFSLNFLFGKPGQFLILVVCCGVLLGQS